jgi:c-di-GMP-binding flagellar brake protein YcgR
LELNEVDKDNLSRINKSIAAYQKGILEDMNATIRITINEKTYITKLVDWPSEKFIIAAPLDQLDWVLIERNKIVKVSFVTKAAIFAARARILNRHKKNEMFFYSASLVSPLVKEQQRQHFRLDVLLEASYKLLPKNDEPYDLEEIPSHKATLVNISAGGMCLVSDQQFSKEQKMIVSFDFLGTSLELCGETLFLGEKLVSGNYTHRMRLINLNSSIKNTLNKLIFEKQRLIMSKKDKQI